MSGASLTRDTIRAEILAATRRGESVNSYALHDRLCRYSQPGTVAVIFDPDGGEHPCFELEEYMPGQMKYWCAGLVMLSPAALADRIHETWNAPSHADPEGDYARREACFGELP